MTAGEHAARMQGLLEAFNSRRFPEYVAAFHENAVIEYPQSGERVHGRSNMLRMFSAFAAPPTFRAWRTDTVGDVVIVHAAANYPDVADPWFAIIEFVFDGGLIARETAYFAPAFPAAQWRSPFVDVKPFA